jgi:DNA-binding NarL/FixJ family response regulator
VTIAFPPKPGTRISARESQVLAGLARGRRYDEIAADLRLSVPTVRTHMTRLAHRYEIQGRAGGAALVGAGYRYGDLTQLPAEPRERVRLGKATLAVLDGMSWGLTNREIGKRRDRDEETVRSLTWRLFKALGATNRPHAVALAYQHGYLTVPAQAQQPAGRAA